jgi:hypothetical protein
MAASLEDVKKKGCTSELVRCGWCDAYGGQSFWDPHVGRPLKQLTPTEVTAVKEANLAFIRDHKITRLETIAPFI